MLNAIIIKVGITY